MNNNSNSLYLFVFHMTIYGHMKHE